MKELIINNEIPEKEEDRLLAEQIVKTDADIIGYINNSEIFSFRGISDFSLFQIKDGEWDIEENKEVLQQELNAKLLKDSANMQIELNIQKKLNADLLLKIAQFGGNTNV